MRTVIVRAVSIPAMSTMGRCVGFDVETDEVVVFYADHRPARHIGGAIDAAEDESDLPIVEVEDWAIVLVDPPLTQKEGV